MGPTFGSLFAGIGGLDLGLELAGWQCSWQVETDRACNWVLGQHWPDVRRYGDITEIKPGQLEAVDLISAGWPCQDLSIAGKRGGLAAERSGLFFQAARLIQGLQPRWLLLEQVPGLFSQNKGHDFAIVIQALAECGYGMAWRVLDSQYFGVAQRRRRVFVVGSLGDLARLGQPQSRQDLPRLAGLPPEVLFEPESLSRGAAPRREAGEELASDVGACLKGGSGKRGFPLEFEAGLVAAPLTRGSASGCGVNDPGRRQEDDVNLVIAAPLKASSPSRRAGGSWPIAEEFVLPFDTTQVTNPSNRSDPKPGDPCHPLSESAHAPAIVQHALSGHNQRNDPDGEHFVVELSRPLVFGQAVDHQDESQQTYVVGTLGSGGNKGLRTGLGERLVAYNWQSGGDVRLSFGKPCLQANQVPAVGVRRLTPTECERLQGFPDGWTEGQADSTRYRQLGNAVTVNVAEWIGKRIAKAHLGHETNRSRDQEGGIDNAKDGVGINADR